MRETKVRYTLLLSVIPLPNGKYKATFEGGAKHVTDTNLSRYTGYFVGIDGYGKWWVKVEDD